MLVGGSVPSILFDEAVPEHVGTLDIDIELNPERMGEYGYVEMVRELEAHGYERNVAGLRAFQMRRTVQMDTDGPIGVVIDLLMPQSAVVPQREEKIVDGLHVQRIDGGEIAIANSKTIAIKGVMPDGRNNSVEVTCV